jgi:hypothetical protein
VRDTNPINTPGAIEVASGRYIDPLCPSRLAITVEDIAHHLAQVNRFNGAARRPMSVADHTLLVADRLRSRGHGAITILGGLHHDDAEAYLNDVCRPLKQELGSVYREAEEEALRAVWDALNLPALKPDEWWAVKTADNWALAAEAYHLLPSCGVGWRGLGRYDPDDPQNPPQEANLLFDERHWTTVRDLWLAEHERWTTFVTMDRQRAVA